MATIRRAFKIAIYTISKDQNLLLILVSLLPEFLLINTLSLYTNGIISETFHCIVAEQQNNNRMNSHNIMKQLVRMNKPYRAFPESGKISSIMDGQWIRVPGSVSL